ncbi:MAG TPA: aromatic acid exporter family protein [Symbiobacteriaceae bacterium]|nr:aromatic acid exporter family protein [Symbiobacteriaceae bacterium]
MGLYLPFRLLSPFVGPRIVKTGLAVFLCLVIAHALGSDYGSFAAVSAIMAVQPSTVRARKAFGQQLLANLIGGLLGAVLGLYAGSSPLVMALGVVLVLWLCTKLDLLETASSAVVAILFIMDRPEHDFLLYTLARIGAIVGGMLIGYMVNRFIHPPDFKAQIQKHLKLAAGEVDLFGQHLLASLVSPEHYAKDQIKSEGAKIKQHLDSAGYFIELDKELGNHSLHGLVLTKARASMFVFVERIMDIHKIALLEDGLQPGDEMGAVARALKAVLRYKETVVAASLGDGPVEAVAAAEYAGALAALEQLVEQRIADPAGRARGLALHSVLTNVRHMGWRMDSLVRLLHEAPGRT